MFAEFDKVVTCLALELPESVHADVVAKYGKLKLEVEKLKSTNSIKAEILPLLEEAKKDLPRVGMLYSEQCINQVMAKLSAV